MSTGVTLAPEDERRFLFEEAPVGIVIVDEFGSIVQVNQAFASLLSSDRASLEGRPLVELLLDDDPGTRRLEARARTGAEPSVLTSERRFRGKDGEAVVGLVTTRAVRDEHGRILNVSHVVDVTALRRVEREVARNALYDRLTNLATRALLLDRLEEAVQRGERRPLAVIGVDGFRRINDLFGHTAGDRVLVEVARRLEAAFPTALCIARVGADEFAIVGEGESPTVLAEMVRFASITDLRQGQSLERITASIGVRGVEPGMRAEEALKDAFTALYRAKERGPGQTAQFDASLRGRATRRAALEQSLREAVFSGNIRAFVQAVYSTRSGRLLGFEALARWEHPTLGWISPQEFVVVAERNGLIHHLGEQVLAAALEAGAKLRTQVGATPDGGPYVAVNVSPIQLQDPSHVRALRDAVERSQVPPEQVRFEVTESILLEPSPAVRDAIQTLDGTGVELVLDDFGTGWSSLSSLREVRFGGLKIDRSFVSRLATDGRTRSLVRAIIDIADDLGLDAVAEGVESSEQARVLRGLGCPAIQGFLFSRPVPPDEFVLLPPQEVLSRGGASGA